MIEIKFGKDSQPIVIEDGKVRKQHLRKGYCKVNVGGKPRFVHRLVAEAYIPNPDGEGTVNHINGCKADNSVSNLEWVSLKYNIEHALNNNLHYRPRSAVQGYDGATGFGVVFKSMQQAKKYGFHQGAISSCCSGKIKSHKGFVWGKIGAEL